MTDSAKKIVEDFAEEFDMAEQAVASRIYEWFGRLPRPAQKWVTGLIDGNEGEGMKLFAEELLGKKRPEDNRMRMAAKPMGPRGPKG